MSIDAAASRRLARVPGKLMTFIRLPWQEQLAFLPAWLLLGLTRFVILMLPFPVVRTLLGSTDGVSPWLHRLSAPELARAHRIGALVRLAARYTPWTSNCFPQALTARLLLSATGLPHSIFLGLRREAGELKAHAWVMAGAIPVTGGHCFGSYAVVGCFAHTPAGWRADAGADA